MIPPDFSTFWSQAAQQGFRPKIVTIGKALLFPSVVASLGPRGNGLTTEIWWTPTFPFKSGLTGQDARQLNDAYIDATKRPWSQPIGYQHALFEVAIDVLKRVGAIIVADESDLTLAEGESLGIIGPNGAGKTTLFGIVSGTVAPDFGRVLYAGRDITQASPAQRCAMGIGRSFQIPLPFAGM